MILPLIDIVMTLIVIGFVLWLVNTYIPMASGIKKILNGVVVVAAGIWLLQATGLWPYSGPRISL
jgi:ABC-type long-subunit fatty acid transport system fused permease/ATPase subunit